MNEDLAESIQYSKNRLAFKKFSQNSDDLGQPWDWKSDVLLMLAKEIRREIFPIHIAATRLMLPKGIFEEIDADGKVISCMADMELALRRADDAGMINYVSGAPALR